MITVPVKCALSCASKHYFVTCIILQGIIFFLAGNLVFGGPDGGPNVPKWDQAGNLDQAPAQYASVSGPCLAYALLH